MQQGPSDTTILSNVTLSLVCDLDGAPFPEVSWTKDRETFNFSERVHLGVYSASLQFDSLELGDSGVYQCFAVNMDGSAESNNATLLVLGEELYIRVCVILCKPALAGLNAGIRICDSCVYLSITCHYNNGWGTLD